MTNNIKQALRIDNSISNINRLINNLGGYISATDNQDMSDAISILRDYKSALSELESAEPVAWMDTRQDVITESRKRFLLDNGCGEEYDTGLYTSPQKQEWVGLSEDEIVRIMDNTDYDEDNFCMLESSISYCRAIEAKLRELNTKG